MFGLRLRALRLDFDLTQSCLGSRIGLTQSAVACLERGLRSPSVVVLTLFAVLMCISSCSWQSFCRMQLN